MMMFRENSAATLFDEIQSDCFVKAERFGEDVAADWRERVAVPVEYITGARGGIQVIRSAPGEPPRRETGALQESILAAVEADVNVITLTIDSDVDYAAFLDAGTSRIAPRPHAPDTDELFERFTDAIIDAIEGK